MHKPNRNVAFSLSAKTWAISKLTNYSRLFFLLFKNVTEQFSYCLRFSVYHAAFNSVNFVQFDERMENLKLSRDAVARRTESVLLEVVILPFSVYKIAAVFFFSISKLERALVSILFNTRLFSNIPPAFNASN